MKPQDLAKIRIEIKPDGFVVWYKEKWIIDASLLKSSEQKIYLSKEAFEFNDKEINSIVYKLKKEIDE